jgi:dihydrolipoamide dehydrogenase
MSHTVKKTPHNYDYDITLIGTGPGGYEAAIRAAQLGFKVCVVEKESTLGGVCLNWGCIPTKSLLRNAEVFETFKHAADFGITGAENFKIDFSKVIKRSRDVAGKMAKGVAYLMKKNKITVEKGFGKLATNHTIDVTDDGKTKTISSQHIILATGTRSKSVPTIPVDRKKIITSYQAMVLEKLPESLVIIGAGAIGVEFAYIYASLGTKVTLIEYLSHILPAEDDEIATLLTKEYKKIGIEMFVSTKVESVAYQGEQLKTAITLSDSTKKDIISEIVLVAIGLTGNIENIGLETLGVKTDRGFIVVDKYGRTNIEGIYAIGDVSGPPLLAHKASAEGIVCVEAIAGLDPVPIDMNKVAACTYCQPGVAHVGLTEKQAKEKGYEVKVGKFPFSASGKATAAGHTEGLVKLVFDAKYGELLGAHIIGYEATEMIAELSLAMSSEATAEFIHKTVHAHPTFSEAVKEAAADSLGEAINI